ncbi:MAG: hypothetical protein ACRDK4_11750 [Solirubrobacteraceae bacterium]
MSRFQERLWEELVRDHATALAYPSGSRDLVPRLTIVEPRVAARFGSSASRFPRLSLRPRRLVAGLAVLAAIVASVSILTTAGTTPSAAYAVTQRPDGTLDVSISELTGVSGANAQLAKLGVSVRVIPVQAGCSDFGQVVPVPPSLAAKLARPGDGGGLAVRPDLVPPGDTLVLTARQSESAVTLGYSLYRGAVPSCIGLGEAHVG